ncbi:hypothetical protein ABZZ79_07375 [Streptomyces sp. NPDC006458]|uniref:hypothetical protein n=1 Tax=Streptomyces sp. NPDC006458 TaxID=3154302 RepID=UPI0033B98AD0
MRTANPYPAGIGSTLPPSIPAGRAVTEGVHGDDGRQASDPRSLPIDAARAALADSRQLPDGFRIPRGHGAEEASR